MSIRMNLNDPVWVRLTPVGEAQYKKWSADLGVPNPIELKKTWDGFVKFQMWELMQIFGPVCFNGCNVPFETEIVLARND